MPRIPVKTCQCGVRFDSHLRSCPECGEYNPDSPQTAAMQVLAALSIGGCAMTVLGLIAVFVGVLAFFTLIFL